MRTMAPKGLILMFMVWNGWTLKSCALTLSNELNILQFFKKTCSSISLKCVTIVLSFISSSKCSFEYLYFLVYRFFFVISVLPTKMSTQYPQPGKTIHISYRMYLKMLKKKLPTFTLVSSINPDYTWNNTNVKLEKPLHLTIIPTAIKIIGKF